MTTSLDLHLAKVRERTAKEDLSSIELRQRAEQKMRTMHDMSVSGAARDLASHEYQLLVGMAREAEAPRLTPEQQIEALREAGDTRSKNSADAMQYALKQRAHREKLYGIEREIALARDGGDRARIQRLEAQRADVETAMIADVHPYAAREQKARELRSEAANLEQQAMALGDDPAAGELLEQSRAKSQEAHRVHD